MKQNDMQDLYNLILLQCTSRGYIPSVSGYTYVVGNPFILEDAEAITKNLVLCGKNPIKATKNSVATNIITANWIQLMAELYRVNM